MCVCVCVCVCVRTCECVHACISLLQLAIAYVRTYAAITKNC